MMKDFLSVKDKTVIVTGAASGIGRAIAECYGAHGMKVVCADIDSEKGEAIKEEIRAKGGVALFRKTDMSRTDDIKSLVDFAVENYGSLHGLVNNAGIGMGGFPLHEYSFDDYERVVSVNLKGVFALMKQGIKSILSSGVSSGFVINIASVSALLAQSGQSLYSATKAGVVSMTKAAAMEYASRNMTVNAICPGYIKTSILDQAPEAAMRFFISQCPAGRMGNPDECADLALFLASDMSRYINGAAIPVDGALSAGARNLMQWKKPEERKIEEK